MSRRPALLLATAAIFAAGLVSPAFADAPVGVSDSDDGTKYVCVYTSPNHGGGNGTYYCVTVWYPF